MQKQLDAVKNQYEHILRALLKVERGTVQVSAKQPPSHSITLDDWQHDVEEQLLHLNFLYEKTMKDMIALSLNLQ